MTTKMLQMTKKMKTISNDNSASDDDNTEDENDNDGNHNDDTTSVFEETDFAGSWVCEGGSGCSLAVLVPLAMIR
jgi:hypothetical protein